MRSLPWSSSLPWGAIGLYAVGLALTGCAAESGAPTANHDNHRTHLTSLEDYDLLSAADGELKFLASATGAGVDLLGGERCAFLNTERYPFHLQFLRTLPAGASLTWPGYEALVLKASQRVLWAGTLRPYPTIAHPSTGAPGVFVWSVASGASLDDAPGIHALGSIQRQLWECAPALAEKLVFVTTEPAIEDQLEELGDTLDVPVVWMSASSVAPDRSAAISEGLSYGYLRVLDDGSVSGFDPQDIVVAPTVPVGLPVVAGLLTAGPQSRISHLALRLGEKGVPNAVVPDVMSDSSVRSLDGRVVRLKVTASRVTLEAASLEEAQVHWSASRPVVTLPDADLEQRSLRAFSDLRYDDAVAYGAKAAGLGELTRAVPAPHRPGGFAIPFGEYAEHLRSPLVRQALDRLLGDPAVDRDAEIRRARLKSLRDAIRGAPLDPNLHQRVLATITERLGTGLANRRIRFRSSANLESLRGFAGAGLYGSRGGCVADDLDDDGAGPSRCLTDEEAIVLTGLLEGWQLRRQSAAPSDYAWMDAIITDLQAELTEERTVADAVRAVYASAWSDIAYAERAWYGLEQRSIAMGIVVHPALVLERVNAVAVVADDLSVQLVSQVGSESVVEPRDPTAVAEVLSWREGEPASAQVEVLSSLAEEELWIAADLAVLSGLLRDVKVHFEQAVFPGPIQVDLRLDAQGRIVLGHVRPYAGHQSVSDPDI